MKHLVEQNFFRGIRGHICSLPRYPVMRSDLTQNDRVAIENFNDYVGLGEKQKSVLIKSDIDGSEEEGPGISWFARY